MAKSKTKKSKILIPVTKKNMYAVLLLDESGSMQWLTKEAQSLYDTTVKTLLDQQDANTNVFVSVITFGSQVRIANKFTQDEKNLQYVYRSRNESTALLDAVMEGSKQLEDLKLSLEDAALMIVLTDGQENASKTSKSTFLAKIQEKNRLDNWTIAFNIPKGDKKGFEDDYGVPSGNVREWEISSQGMRETEVKTSGSLLAYSDSFKSGNLRSISKNFYQNVQVDTDGLSNNVVKNNLVKVTNNFTKILVNGNQDGDQIRNVVENRGIPYHKGMAYYELVKKEIIQEYKDIVVENVKGQLYSGSHARNLLGLPQKGNLKVIPEDYSNFTIYIQSTSYNRKVQKDTKILVKK